VYRLLGRIDDGREVSSDMTGIDKAVLRIALAQANFLVGDIRGNAEKVIQLAQSARDSMQADLIVFPELTLTGYPPEDLLLRSGLNAQVEESIERIAGTTSGIDVVLGYPALIEGRRYNAAGVIRDGAVLVTYCKQALPNYGVFDEKRYFTEGQQAVVFEARGIHLGLTVCEDIWEAAPVSAAVAAGAQAILNINASPYHLNKWRSRQQQVSHQARTHKVPIVYVNLIGGQDELVFDGHSFVVDGAGQVTQDLPVFEEDMSLLTLDSSGNPVAGERVPEISEEESVYRALVCGVRDYIEKNRFPGASVGLSGGIDSALTLAIAVDALGVDRVEAVMMPSAYTRDISLQDAQQMAETLGVEYSVLPISSLVEAYNETLKQRFAGYAQDVTEENIQARIRGNLLMAISNKTGRMLLTTGNKSEMAVGYATLYGDMAGGYAAIKDVPKTLVYRLARYRNERSPVIPQRVITRAPSAELAPDQKDSDSLPDYEILDAILERYVERDQCPEEIVASGFDEEIVDRVVRMVDRAEYKRRQAAPGVRITPRAFGRDRRYPITSGYKNR